MTDIADPIARYAIAGTFLEALAAQDFQALGATVAEGADLAALVPRGLRHAAGSEELRALFTEWFGDTEDFELVEAVVGDVGSQLYMRWRVRLRALRLGAGWFVIEQHAYIDTNADGRISKVRLLCSGRCPERGDDE